MDEIEQKDVDLPNDEQPVEETEVASEETKEAPPKKEYTLEEKLARVSRMKAKLEKELGIAEPKKEADSKGNTGESDIEDLLLEVKGIQDPEQVALFEKWKSDTGRNARQILSNETFQKELATLKAAQAVKDATPSSTKRSGAGAENLDTALAKYEQTGELPADFELRSALVNALEERTNASRPNWRK